VLWRDVDLDMGVLNVTSTLIRIAGSRGRGWCGRLRNRRRVSGFCSSGVVCDLAGQGGAVGVGADEPVFGTVDGTFRDPRQ
jgi:hypothetical protein